MSTVQQNRQKDWVQKLFVPYVVFFALSCLISVLAMIVKLQILRKKFLSRDEAAVLMVALSPTSRLTTVPQVKTISKPIASTKATGANAAHSKVAELKAKVCARGGVAC